MSEDKTYENWCSVLQKYVTLGWYDKECECGEPIAGVPERP